MPCSDNIRSKIDKTVREEWGRILASLTKTLGDLQLAEDSLQDAVESALRHWAKNGLPNAPAAWLIQTARRKAIDRIRRSKNFSRKEAQITHLMELDAQASIEDAMIETVNPIPDKRLEMIFTCCHPALEEKSRIALTLRTIGGLSTEEIANSFLDNTEAMAARLTRAKKKIAQAGIPYEVPKQDTLSERLKSVLSVIYLIFNEGYSASKGDHLIREELCEEALRLVALMEKLLPGEVEITGLHALILLHGSRRTARQDASGRFIPLEHQDRTLWDQNQIRAGTDFLKSALTMGKIGPYQLQAAISACHSEAACWKDTDWAQILALYDLLYASQPSPVVKLNQTYALSFTRPLNEAFQWLQEIEKELNAYQPFYLVKADLLKRDGNMDAAIDSMKQAIKLTSNEAEKRFLQIKLKDMRLN
ncbi:MAG: RNA polymerase sigma factor [Salaquimonas sp.]